MGESSVDGNFPMAVFDIPDNVKRVQVCRCSFPHRCSWFHLISVQLPASIGARGNIVDLPMSQSRHGPNNQIVPDTSTKQKWQPMPRYGTPRRVCCKQLPAASESCFRFRKGPSFVCCSSCPTLRQAAGLCPPSRSSAAPWSGPRRNVARITSKSRWNASDFDLKHHHKPSTKYNYMVSIEIMSGINLSIRKKKRHCVVCQERRLNSGIPGIPARTSWLLVRICSRLSWSHGGSHGIQKQAT